MSNYLVATLTDRIQAEAAFTDLEKAGLPMETISLFGRGYRSPEETPLWDPTLAQWRGIKRMMIWLLPFGFFAGCTFNQITQLTIVPGLGRIGDAVLGGLFGLGASLLGAFAYGGGSELYLNRDLMPYVERLEKGKYLIVVDASEQVVQKANRVLQKCDTQNLQLYETINRES